MRSRLKNLVLCALGATAVLGVTASGAAAATTVGQTAPTPAASQPCAGGTLFLSNQTAPGSPTYVVPAGGGVLTQWSVQGAPAEPGTLELKVVRETAPSTFAIVGQDPLPRGIVPGQLNPFDVRIPVTGGELLALWVPNGGNHPCYYAGSAGDAMLFKAGNHPEPQVGETFNTNVAAGGFRVNVSGLLEPDSDRDGYGDETQDGCPQEAASRLVCTDSDGDGLPNFRDACPTTASDQGGGCADRDRDGVPDIRDACPAVSGTGANGCDVDAPETFITEDPEAKGKRNRVKYEFASDEAGSTFQCKVDKKAWKACKSGAKYKVSDGKHKFEVRAVDPSGNTDTSPDTDKFRVLK